MILRMILRLIINLSVNQNIAFVSDIMFEDDMIWYVNDFNTWDQPEYSAREWLCELFWEWLWDLRPTWVLTKRLLLWIIFREILRLKINMCAHQENDYMNYFKNDFKTWDQPECWPKEEKRQPRQLPRLRTGNPEQKTLEALEYKKKKWLGTNLVKTS